MRYEAPLVPALFRRREKRFSVLAEIVTPDGPAEVWSHCPNPGRLTSCLEAPGTPLFLSPLPFNPKNPGGYRFRTEQSEPLPGVRVGINPNRANVLARELFSDPEADVVPGWTHVGSEVPYGNGSRIDHLFRDGEGRLVYVEVKSVTYREGERALFPDAVSERAVRHLSELVGRVEDGDRSLLLFVVQRADCRVAAPADLVHPAYGEALRKASKWGVEVRAVRFEPETDGIRYRGEMPVDL